MIGTSVAELIRASLDELPISRATIKKSENSQKDLDENVNVS